MDVIKVTKFLVASEKKNKIEMMENTWVLFITDKKHLPNVSPKLTKTL